MFARLSRGSARWSSRGVSQIKIGRDMLILNSGQFFGSFVKSQPMKPKFNLCRRISSSKPISRHPNSTTSTSTTTSISRTERRAMQRKERNRSKRIEQQKITDRQRRKKSVATYQERLNRFQEYYSWMISFTPVQKLIRNFPGRSFHKDHWIALVYRLPAFLVLAYCMTDDDITPYTVKASLGPSMLPTIQFCGDLWLVETGSWGRAWRSLCSFVSRRSYDRREGGDTASMEDSNETTMESMATSMASTITQKSSDEEPFYMSIMSPQYTVGDLLLWEDESTGRISCKRVVGVEGDEVQRYGEFASTLYSMRNDKGIIWPSDAADRGLDCDPNSIPSWDTSTVMSSPSTPQNLLDNASEDERRTFLDLSRRMVVPKNHLWLEGDCPLFSVDSRQYGPIPKHQIRGRLLLRLWPWNRPDILERSDNENNAYLSSCRVSKQRPTPYRDAESYLGRRFGFYRVPKEGEALEEDK